MQSSSICSSVAANASWVWSIVRLISAGMGACVGEGSGSEALIEEMRVSQSALVWGIDIVVLFLSGSPEVYLERSGGDVEKTI